MGAQKKWLKCVKRADYRVTRKLKKTTPGGMKNCKNGQNLKRLESPSFDEKWAKGAEGWTTAQKKWLKCVKRADHRVTRKLKKTTPGGMKNCKNGQNLKRLETPSFHEKWAKGAFGWTTAQKKWLKCVKRAVHRVTRKLKKNDTRRYEKLQKGSKY